MRRALVLVLVALGAAGCAEQQVAGRASVRRGSKQDVLTQLSTALGRGGHKCIADEDGDLVCDAERHDVPAVIISLHDGPGGLHLNLLSAFRWKSPDPCAELVKTVNKFNGRASSYYAVCTPDGLTLQTVLVVPETGLSDHDVHAFVNWWGGTTFGLARRIAEEGKVELAQPGG